MFLNTSYNDSQCDCDNIKTTRLPYISYDSNGSPDGYFWYYGDEVVLKFHFTGTVTDTENLTYQTVDEFFSGKTANIKIYDFRGEVWYEKNVPASSDMSFAITNDDSHKLVPGVYTCRICVYENEILQTTVYNSDPINLVVK